MGGYTQTTLRDANGAIVGYQPITADNPYVSGGIIPPQTTIQKLSDAGIGPSQNFLDIQNRYAQQHYANVGSGGTVLSKTPPYQTYDTRNAVGILATVVGDDEKNPRGTVDPHFEKIIQNSNPLYADWKMPDSMKSKDAAGNIDWGIHTDKGSVTSAITPQKIGSTDSNPSTVPPKEITYTSGQPAWTGSLANNNSSLKTNVSPSPTGGLLMPVLTGKTLFDQPTPNTWNIIPQKRSSIPDNIGGSGTFDNYLSNEMAKVQKGLSGSEYNPEGYSNDPYPYSIPDNIGSFGSKKHIQKPKTHKKGLVKTPKYEINIDDILYGKTKKGTHKPTKKPKKQIKKTSEPKLWGI